MRKLTKNVTATPAYDENSDWNLDREDDDKDSSISSSRQKQQPRKKAKRGRSSSPSASSATVSAAATAERRDEYLMRKYFDLDVKYGPCISISRKERWLRAVAFACDPPLFVWSLICKYDKSPFLLRPTTSSSAPLPRYDILPYVVDGGSTFAMDLEASSSSSGADVRGDDQQQKHGYSLWESI